MYLSCATRLDISFAVSKLSRFVSNPGDGHSYALERVLCYLKGTMSYGIHYTGDYCDANWISDADELYAASGYVFLLGGGAISWKSYKQTILSRSTMEAELTTLDTASVEAKWLRELLMDVHLGRIHACLGRTVWNDSYMSILSLERYKNSMGSTSQR
ncbi:hypothetical protein U9M48_041301 [Paspalum notatum var. saurae]|uniref:Uncharacterized protein n=1 Tax=Paspalum notatum var. saurae TaxID=547442 RepID=A0AAQ3UMY9_PASNO